MPNHPSKPKRSHYINQLVKFVVDLSTGETSVDPEPVAEPIPTILAQGPANPENLLRPWNSADAAVSRAVKREQKV